MHRFSLEEWNDMSARLAKANKAKNDAMVY